MGQKNVTVSLDEETYKKYKKYCEENAIALSKSIENFMRKQVEETD